METKKKRENKLKTLERLLNGATWVDDDTVEEIVIHIPIKQRDFLVSLIKENFDRLLHL